MDDVAEGMSWRQKAIGDKAIKPDGEEKPVKKKQPEDDGGGPSVRVFKASRAAGSIAGNAIRKRRAKGSK